MTAPTPAAPKPELAVFGNLPYPAEKKLRSVLRDAPPHRLHSRDELLECFSQICEPVQQKFYDLDVVIVMTMSHTPLLADTWLNTCWQQTSQIKHRRNLLKHLLVWRDLDTDLHDFSDLDVFSTSDPAVLYRVVKARSQRDAAGRIARAELLHGTQDDELFVTACDFQTYRLPFGHYPALAHMSHELRRKFHVDKSGFAIWWDEADVSIDLDAVRAAVDERYAEHMREQFKARMTHVGIAIKAMREEAGLRQGDFDVSERTLRRVEHGDVTPQLETLRTLAAGHGLSLEAYLRALAERAANVGTENHAPH